MNLKHEIATLLDGSKVRVNEILLSTWKETRESDDEFDNEVMLVVACTDLPAEVVDDMDTPDFNELKRLAIKVNNPSYEPEKGTSFITLSHPALTVMGESLTDVQINMPKVRASRELAKIKKPQARLEFMIKAATQLVDLDSMPMSDFSLFAVAVPPFFSQGVGYFRQVKSKSF